LFKLFSLGNLLVSLVDTRKLAEESYLARGTVISALNRLESWGAFIKIPGDRNHANLYILGFSYQNEGQNVDFLFSSSPLLRKGIPVPDRVRAYIKEIYQQPRVLAGTPPYFDHNLTHLLFHPETPLLEQRYLDEIEDRKRRELIGIIRAEQKEHQRLTEHARRLDEALMASKVNAGVDSDSERERQQFINEARRAGYIH
jgi:hypothetical protein